MGQQEKKIEEPGQLTADNGIFAGPQNVQQSPSAKELFGPGVDIAKIERAVKNCDTPGPAHTAPKNTIFKLIIIFFICVIFIALLIPVSLFCFSAVVNPQQSQTPVQAAAPTPAPEKAKTTETESADLNQPASWKLAQDLMQKQDYSRAIYAYRKLAQNCSAADPYQSLLRDYFNLQVAVCGYKLDETKSGESFFTKVFQSSSPAVLALAHYNLAFIHYRQNNFSLARTQAYQALALFDTIDKDLSAALVADCYFLIANALTEQLAPVISQTSVAPSDWPKIDYNIPFENIDEAKLHNLLQSGTAPLRSAALGPVVEKLKQSDGTVRWYAKCRGASLNELLTRYAASGGSDLIWVCDFEQVRNRATMLYLPCVTATKFTEIATGSAGLIATFKDDKVVIYNPDVYSSPVQHQAIVLAESINAWQRFALSYKNDKRQADAHFAIGLLQKVAGQSPTAISEFRQVANRYSQSPLAAYALLNAGKLCLPIKDYAGASEDFRQIVIQYPDCPVSDQANVYLAEISMAMGDYDKAQMLYRKLCNLEVSDQCKVNATLGAAKAFYALADFTSASDWFDRYIKLAKTTGADATELQNAYVLLAQSNARMGNMKNACEGYINALAGSDGKNFDVAMELVNAFKQQDNYVEALETLEQIDLSDLSAEQICRFWIFKSQLLRSIQLPDQALSILQTKLPSVQDNQLRTQMDMEMAYCNIDLKEYKAARDNLCRILFTADSGPGTALIQCELADVCLKMNENKQAIDICSKVLKAKISQQLRDRVLKILATAYKNENQPDKAAIIFSGMTASSK